MEASSIISLSISGLAIVGTLFTYFKHDKRIKSQESRLNQYQINKIEEEETDKKKAQIRGNSMDEGKNGKKLRIYNAGKAKATNIRIEFLDGIDPRTISMEQFPYKLLNPQDNTEIIFSKYSCPKPTITVKLIWDDEFQKNNEFEQVFTI